MVSKITKGIKVVVKVRYAGQSLRLNTLLNFFNYEISIENRNSNTVQLLRRYWLIKDSLNNDATVEGEGVVGKTPVINPEGIFEYTSGCSIMGYTGSMQGYFTFVDLSTSEIFHVKIPLFNMSIPKIFN